MTQAAKFLESMKVPIILQATRGVKLIRYVEKNSFIMKKLERGGR
uniref:Uncharacterized protein n=1 Tax=Physcomitrium patens TaxID=3218 RepID=A0A2K1L7Z9_PHYPA|nr:hypothetical protein PHYPA_000594 [Physcomitrium patens]